MPLKSIALDTIRLDGNCQPPGRLGEEEVADYAQQMKDGLWDWQWDNDDPVTVYQDGGDLWLAHGFHRYHAARRAGLATIECLVRTGTQADAQEYAAGCNQQTSRRRSNADKQWAVDTVFRLHPDWSDGKIAEHVGVSHTMVSSRRPTNSQSLRVGADGKTRKVPQRGAKFHTPAPSGPPPAPPRKDEPCQSQPQPSSDLPESSSPSSSAPASTTPSSESQNVDTASLAISRSGEIKAFANEITAFKKRIHDAFQTDPIGAYLNWNYIDTQIANLRQAITHAIPHAPCPNAPNCSAGRCTACKGRGWLNERDFEEAERMLGEAA